MRKGSVGQYAIDNFWDLIVEDYKRPQKLVLRNIIDNIENALDGMAIRKITNCGRNEENGKYFIEVQGEELYL